jgi:hypothetical protein
MRGKSRGDPARGCSQAAPTHSKVTQTHAAGQLPPEGVAEHADREAAVQRPLPLYARVIFKGDAIKGTVFGPDGTHPRIIQEPA